MTGREYTPFSPSENDVVIINSLNEKRRKAAELEETAYEDPNALSQQIELYAFMLGDIGDLYSQAVYRYKKSYADRKREQGVEKAKREGTVSSRDGQAEITGYTLRLAESERHAEMERWSKAYTSLQEIINAKKRTLDVLCAHLFGRATK